MKKLFYKDKVIIFDSKNNNYLQKDIIFEDNPTVNVVLERFEDTNSLVIISDDADQAFLNFQSNFKLITAAGGVVENHRDEVLMIYRNERWDLPKGKQEEGETLRECAVREVMEETGVDSIETYGEPFSTLHFYKIKGRWELKTTYWYSMIHKGDADKKLIPQYVEGITKCKWLSKTKMRVLLHSSYATITEVIEQLVKNK